MRLLHLVGRSHRRGAEQVALELADELDRRGHSDRLVAVSTGHEGERTERLAPLVPDPHQGPGALLRAARALRRDIRRAPVDVVLAHGGAAAMVAALGRPRPAPALAWQRILGLTEASFTGLQGLAWRVAVGRVDGVVTLSPELGDELGRLGYRGPVWLVPNARRTERFADLDRAAARRRLGEELGLAPAVALVGVVGYLVEQKRPERAVEVLAGLRRGEVDAHLVVAGSGPCTAAVAQRADALGVTDHVTLLGHRDDIAAVLGGLDVVVLTSDAEGVPGVLIEAALARCPVVTFPVGGVADVVADGVTGVVLAEPSVPAMTTAVGALLRDPPAPQVMEAAAAAAAEAHSMATVARRYEEVLGSLR